MSFLTKGDRGHNQSGGIRPLVSGALRKNDQEIDAMKMKYERPRVQERRDITAQLTQGVRTSGGGIGIIG